MKIQKKYESEKEKKEEDKSNEKVNDEEEKKEDIKLEIKLGKEKLGIFPIKPWHLRECYRGDSDPDLIPDIDFLTRPEYSNERCEAAVAFLHKELSFGKNDIKIRDARMARDPGSMIMWIDTTEASVKRIYHRAAQIKNKDIQLITYFPGCLYRRKRNLDSILRTQRALDPKLRTQIRLGNTDIQLFTKMFGDPQWTPTPVDYYGDPDVDPPIPPPIRRTPSVSQPIKRKTTSPATKDDTVKKHRSDLNDVDPFDSDIDIEFDNPDTSNKG